MGKHRRQQRNREGPTGGPYARPKLQQSDELDRLISTLAEEVLAQSEGRCLPVAELGDRVAGELRQQGVHPHRGGGQIIRLSAYMKGVHAGWVHFLQTKASARMRVDDSGTNATLALSSEGRVVEPTVAARPPEDVNAIDLSPL